MTQGIVPELSWWNYSEGDNAYVPDEKADSPARDGVPSGQVTPVEAGKQGRLSSPSKPGAPGNTLKRTRTTIVRGLSRAVSDPLPGANARLTAVSLLLGGEAGTGKVRGLSQTIVRRMRVAQV